MSQVEAGTVLLGKYRVEAILGEGAFGLVYRATTISSGRVVALKVMKENADPLRVGRFVRELKSVAALSDPHTLTMFDHGKTEDGLLVMVTEYIDGEDLNQLLARRDSLRPSEVRRILMQALHSLREAHRLGILHRDLKPSNLRIYELNDDPMRVKVLDFGLAKSLRDEESESLTMTGRVVGTPRYMAPEQLRGEELNAATDIYGLGIVAYEMVVGCRRLQALPPILGVELQLREDELDDPKLRSVINKMLKYSRQARYASAQAVLDDLRAPRATQTGDSPLPSPRPAPRRVVIDDAPAARPKWPWVLVVGAAFAVMGAVAWSFFSESKREVVVVRQVASPLLKGGEEEPVAAVVEVDKSRPVGCGTPKFKGIGHVKRKGGFERFRAYVPPSYTGHEQVPLVLFVASGAGAMGLPPEMLKEDEDERPHEQVLRDVAAGLGGVVVNLTVDNLLDEDLLFRALDAVTESLCVDEERIYLIAANSAAFTAAQTVGCAAGVRAWVSSGARPLATPACAMSYMRIVEAGDDTWVDAERRDFLYASSGAGADSSCRSVRMAPEPAMVQRWAELLGCGGELAGGLGCRSSTCEHGNFARCELPTGRVWAPVIPYEPEDQMPGRAPIVKGCYGQFSGGFDLAGEIVKFFKAAGEPVANGGTISPLPRPKGTREFTPFEMEHNSFDRMRRPRGRRFHAD